MRVTTADLTVPATLVDRPLELVLVLQTGLVAPDVLAYLVTLLARV